MGARAAFPNSFQPFDTLWTAKIVRYSRWRSLLYARQLQMLDLARATMPGAEAHRAALPDLPFDDDEFDTVTMSFGLRNVDQPKKALRELRRVTKPGGRIVVCEFSTPPSALFGGLYRFYNDRVLPRVARVVSSNSEAYDYLNESIRHWPDQPTLSAWMREEGWVDVAYRNLSLGIVALHRGTNPS